MLALLNGRTGIRPRAFGSSFPHSSITARRRSRSASFAALNFSPAATVTSDGR
jgi:hypothetical protein